ncbi:MAG: RHS repeat-associated core domain-containing protein [Kiritimatiellae bacterium]|nr:RHS repeat-associated core domain-containing protein [Kiritimatiellia bacterium]
MNRLTEIENRDGESIAFSRYRYGYDALDRRTNVQHLAGDYWSYDYNSRSELTNAVRRWPDNAMVYGQDFAYVYDAIGNRTVSTRDGQSSLYNANELNQYSNRTLPGSIHVLGSAHTNAMVLVNEQPASRQEEYFHEALVVDNDEAAVYPLINVMGLRAGAGPEGEDVVRVETGHVFLAQTPEVFIYDDDGNLLEDGRWLYTWDGENRLIAMETHTNLTGIITMKKLEFTYDGESRRISKKVYRDEEGDWELEKEWRFVYDGWNLVRELDGGNTPVRSYIWGLDLSQSLQGAGGVGGLLAIVDIADDSVYYAAYDGNGNLTALVDSLDGDQSAIYEYDAYGNIIRLSGEYASQNPFRFSTKYADDETDLVYYGYRFYSPGLGRWTSRDPIGEKGFQTALIQSKTFTGDSFVEQFAKEHRRLRSLQRANVWDRELTDLGVKWKTDHVRVAANGAEESTSQSSFDAKREAYVALSNNPISQIDPLGLVTLEECEQEFEDCNEGCRQMPNGTAAEKCARALCWGWLHGELWWLHCANS